MKVSNILTLSLALLFLTSCVGNSNLEEVMIPDPEIISIVELGSPNDVKANEGSFELTKLNYKYNEYIPFLDSKSLELHYATYYLKATNKLNKLVKDTEYENMKISTLLNKVKYNDTQIEECAVDYFNHSFFFSILGKENYKNPTGELMDQIVTDFGSYTALKSEFTTTARENNGGWVWLIQNKAGQLSIVHSSDNTNPLLRSFKQKGNPLLVLDLSEHAYFLKYNFNKNDYIFNFFKAINWEVVEQKHLEYLGITE